MVASIGCSSSGLGLVFHKPLSQKQRGTFLHLQPAPALISSVDWGLEVKTAIDELQQELTSEDMLDAITLEIVPPPEAVAQAQEHLKLSVAIREPTFQAKFDKYELEISGFLVSDSSPNDPYVVVEATSDSRVLVIVSTQHPHWKLLSGSEGVFNYLRHCTYDAIAEWQARRKQASLDPDTIKVLKDRMLRLSLEIEMQGAQ